MAVNMSDIPPTSSSKDLFSSPALSLSLAGIFRHAEVVEAGEEGSGGGGRKRHETTDISSENSGPTRSRSEDIDLEGGHDILFDDVEDDDEDDGNKNKKKRKKYHRHTAEQIKEMEVLFKESPHPDEKQRLELSNRLGLAPRQVKFWFQNRRTQLKAMQERHENSILKSELDKLREENKAMKEYINKGSCPHCGLATTAGDISMETHDPKQLRLENARLKSEVENLRAALGKYVPGSSSPSTSSGKSQENKTSLDLRSGVLGIEETRITEILSQATEELRHMATAGEPLWIRSVETGRDILNYDEYMKAFSNQSSSSSTPKRSIEASRESGIVFMDIPRLVQSFMDVNQWKEMFSCMVSKAATVDVICSGEGANNDGAIQLMFAELQMLTPMVPTREVFFVRYCKQVSADSWAIVDVSIDKVEDDIDAPLIKCRKRPSGCLIEDKANGHCKVIWVEHLECQKSTIHPMYRTIVNSGLAFGAKHGIATLQIQCERLVFFMATNIPTKDSTGVTTLAGRKSILKLAQRMTCNFSQAIGASSYNTWTKIIGKRGEDIRVSSRKNLNDPGKPTRMIVCAVSSVLLPVSPNALFLFLRGEAHKNEWDIVFNRGPAQTIAYLAKGKDRGNGAIVQAIKTKENNLWVFQDCYTNDFESMVVYSPVDINEMQSVMTGCDSSNVSVLPSGFSILPDGFDSRPQVISSRQEERSTDGGSLLTLAFQAVSNSSPAAKLSMEALESVNNLISRTLQKIKTSLQCDD